ncbi:MAG: response regulator transcription factor [Candidatus Limiplasma sp.]|nr:response regulator transcription factor [Candidatus Limiplasma sp.]
MKILIAEDDPEIAQIEKDYLEINGYEVTVASDGEEALVMIRHEHFDLLLLDWMLPKKSGLDVCREIRGEMDIPIIMVTAKTESTDKILGLGIGADDYIGKPFDIGELVARVKANLAQYRRLRPVAKQEIVSLPGRCIVSGELYVYIDAYKVFLGEHQVKLTTREYELLFYMALNPNIVLSKEKLFENVWGYEFGGDNATVTVHINHIREKIEKDTNAPQFIETVWGVGYRFNIL